jgi:hypothetical protein
MHIHGPSPTDSILVTLQWFVLLKDFPPPPPLEINYIFPGCIILYYVDTLF